ncbi:MAG: DUF1275 family protein [Hyphomonadaceae bacterium]
MSEASPEGPDLSVRLTAIASATALIAFWLVAIFNRHFLEHYVGGELGIIENAQFLILVAAILIVLATLARPSTWNERWLAIWLALFAVGLIYIAGEEISWGQHYFRWATTGWFELHNDQGETNLHNTSSWLDQKPRALLLVGMIVGGIIHPLVKLARRGKGLFDRPWWLAPTLAATPPALAAEIAALPERLDDVLPTNLQFYRASEVEELFLYAFLVVYVLSIARRLRA